mmetsp:Transcript_18543/g.52990  ORF Transcript_18543/g.52990 Transcript_18543/m.52990 type:complete len:533 (+) Transcript_18543:230-1828(+)
MGILTNATSNKDLASWNCHLLAVDLLASRSSHDANVSNLDLAAAVGASSPVNADRTIHGHQVLQLLGQTLGVRLRLDQRQAAKLGAGARHQVALDEAGVGGKARPLAQHVLLQQLLHPVLVHVRQDGVLLHRQPDLAAAVLVGEVGQVATLGLAQAPSRNVHAHAHLALLLLLVHAQQLAPLEGLRGARLLVLHLHAAPVALHLLRHGLLEAFHAVLLHQPHQPRLLPVLALALVAEDAQHRLAERHHALAVGGDPHAGVHRLGHALDGHVPAQHDVEAHLAGLGVRARLHADVVDVRVRVVVAGAADGDVELARQVGPLRVAPRLRHGVHADQVVHGVAQLARVHQLLVVDARQRAAHHVAHAVERRLEGRLVAGVQAVDDGVGVLDLDAPQLDVGPGGDVDHPHFLAVLVHAVGVEPHLVGVDDAVGDLEPHHELSRRPLVAVQHSDVFEAGVQVGLLDLLPRHLTLADLAGVLVHVDPCRGWVLGELDLFSGISLLGPLDGFFWKKGRSGGLAGPGGHIILNCRRQEGS